MQVFYAKMLKILLPDYVTQIERVLTIYIVKTIFKKQSEFLLKRLKRFLTQNNFKTYIMRYNATVQGKNENLKL